SISAGETVTCTFTNTGKGNIIVKKVTSPSPDPTTTSFNFTANYPTAGSTFSLKNGEQNDSGQLLEGTYSVAETVPTNWALTSKTCDDGSDPSSIGLSPGETVTCTFTNTLQVGAIDITKTRKHAADGSGDHPQAGVDFDVSPGPLGGAPVTVTTGANGHACVSGLFLGSYTVHEHTPIGYAGEADKTVNVSSTGDCTSSATAVSFRNTPLTDITVSVNSQVDGGTSSTISCVNSANSTVASGATGGNGDGSATGSNLTPGTYVCTVVVDP